MVAKGTNSNNFWPHVSINNSGTVLINSFAALVTGPDATADRVIGAGDPLFGSTVTYFRSQPSHGGRAINDSGQIVFRYRLANGEAWYRYRHSRMGITVGSSPSISSNSVFSATSFGGSSLIGPGSWIEIYGSNLASTTTTWSGADFCQQHRTHDTRSLLKKRRETGARGAVDGVSGRITGSPGRCGGAATGLESGLDQFRDAPEIESRCGH